MNNYNPSFLTQNEMRERLRKLRISQTTPMSSQVYPRNTENQTNSLTEQYQKALIDPKNRELLSQELKTDQDISNLLKEKRNPNPALQYPHTHRILDKVFKSTPSGPTETTKEHNSLLSTSHTPSGTQKEKGKFDFSQFTKVPKKQEQNSFVLPSKKENAENLSSKRAPSIVKYTLIGIFIGALGKKGAIKLESYTQKIIENREIQEIFRSTKLLLNELCLLIKSGYVLAQPYLKELGNNLWNFIQRINEEDQYIMISYVLLGLLVLYIIKFFFQKVFARHDKH